MGVRGTGWHLLGILIKLFCQEPHWDSMEECVPNNGIKLLHSPIQDINLILHQAEQVELMFVFLEKIENLHKSGQMLQ